ncbi:hypothetical protein K402DRAFT_452388 [Aulographum hederae CBS 113979]|uniref:Uncharacterized protein n=1 Tax=Aulographum hederae CBS 113979 TaxID=1176131 RepID=A0A6G1H7F3_9PEZI|nr:hypothetical protein K402DRAFT_452388 [Aulographum hederae CBS 113979]
MASELLTDQDLAADLSNLTVDTTKDKAKPSSQNARSSRSKPKSQPVAESWEDIDSGSDTAESSTETEDTSSSSTSQNLAQINTVSPPGPPPPTPSSPNYKLPYSLSNSSATKQSTFEHPSRRETGDAPQKRPEKSMATANRLIAAGLGMRPPKRSTEEREYDRVVREKERKKRDQQKAEQQRLKDEEERAKKSVWDD